MWRINNSFCFSILLVLDLCPWKSMLTYWCWSCLSSCFPCRSSECDGVTLCDTSWQLVTDGEWSGGSKPRSASQLTPQWLPDYGAHHSPLRTAFRKYFHFKFSLSHAQGALLICSTFKYLEYLPAAWPSGYLSSPNICYNLPFLPSRHLTLNLKPKLLGIVSQWLLQAVSVGTKKVLTMAWNMNWPIGVFTIHRSPLVKSWTADTFFWPFLCWRAGRLGWATLTPPSSRGPNLSFLSASIALGMLEKPLCLSMPRIFIA